MSPAHSPWLPEGEVVDARKKARRDCSPRAYGDREVSAADGVVM